MTKALFFITEKGYTGFTVTGHSGYADAGHDIVCAAVSSAVSFAASMLEKAGCDITFESDENTPSICLKTIPCKCGDRIIETLFEQLEAVSEDYGKYLSVVRKHC